MAKRAGLSISRRGLVGAAGAGLASLAVGANGIRSVARAAELGRASHLPIPLEEPVPLDRLETPALLLDLDAFERNLEKMARHGRARKIGLRPHGKTHKCGIIARRQIDKGAVGICAAKVSEAEVFVEAGVEEVLITSPVATPEKVLRIVELAKRAPTLTMVIDNEKSARDFDAAARAAGVVLRVLVGLDTGTRRTGIALGDPALALVDLIARLSHLDFRGLQAYAGHVMHVQGHAPRKERSIAALEPCLDTRERIERAGHRVQLFTGGGTGTFDIDCDIEGVTDLQVGSYIFMDVQYRAIGDREGDVFDSFEPALFVLATAISQPVKEAITVDAGGKAFAYEPKSGPEFRHLDGLLYHYGGDEHGIVQFLDDRRPLKLGQKAQLIVSHCDPTVNLYDVIHPFRDGVVTELWPIDARGRSQ